MIYYHSVNKLIVPLHQNYTKDHVWGQFYLFLLSVYRTVRCICVIVNRAISMERFNSLYVYEWDSLASNYVNNTCSFVAGKQRRCHHITRTRKIFAELHKESCKDIWFCVFNIYIPPYFPVYVSLLYVWFSYSYLRPPFVPLMYFIYLFTSYIYLVLLRLFFFSIECIKLSCDVSRWES